MWSEMKEAHINTTLVPEANATSKACFGRSARGPSPVQAKENTSNGQVGDFEGSRRGTCRPEENSIVSTFKQGRKEKEEEFITICLPVVQSFAKELGFHTDEQVDEYGGTRSREGRQTRDKKQR